jgi:hypothetical protein
MLETLESLFEPGFLDRAVSLPVPKSAMHAGERHDGHLYFTNEAVLFTHRYWVAGKVLELKPPYVVDLGCGEGLLLKDMRHNRLLQPYFGVDVRRLLKTDRNSFYLHANLLEEDWCMKPDCCDFMVLSEVLEHFKEEDGLALLGRITYSLRSGGTLVLTCPINHPAESPEKDEKKYGHLCYWQWDVLKSVLEENIGPLKEVWPGRFLRDRWSLAALKERVRVKYDDHGLQLIDDMISCYGQRVVKSVLSFLQEPAEATHIRCVVTKA